MPKTIFIAARVPVVVRYFLRSGLLPLLKKDGALRIVFVVPQNRRELYAKEFGKDAEIIGVPVMPHSFAARFLLFCSHIGLDVSTNTLIRLREHIVDGRNAAITRFKGLLTHALHNSNLFKKIIRDLETRISPVPELAHAFETYPPSLVFSTALMDDAFDIPVLREAKRRGIRTVAVGRNWDNFVTYGVTLLLPDWLLAQNQFLVETAVQFQAMPEKKIRIIGFPHFDWYGKKELLQTREEFCRELGIDSAKKIILYGAMGDFLFKHEGEIANTFDELMESGKIREPAIMVFRKHPAFASPLERMQAMRHVVPDTARAERWSTGDPAADFEDLKHFINSLYHSDIVVTAASTVGMEAAIFDKPVISAAFEKTSTPYWLSAQRFRDHFYHWEELMKCGGVRKADSPQEFADAINGYLENPRRDAEGRACVRERFVGPCDGKATERLAQSLAALARGEQL